MLFDIPTLIDYLENIQNFNNKDKILSMMANKEYYIQNNILYIQ